MKIFCEYCGADITGLVQRCDLCGAPINVEKEVFASHSFVSTLSGDLPNYMKSLVDIANKYSKNSKLHPIKKIIFEVYCCPQYMLNESIRAKKLGMSFSRKKEMITIKIILDYNTYITLDTKLKNCMIKDKIEDSLTEVIKKYGTRIENLETYLTMLKDTIRGYSNVSSR